MGGNKRIEELCTQIETEAVMGDKTKRDKLEKLRLAGLRLFIKCIKHLEPLKLNLPELQKEQIKIIDEYKNELYSLGIDVTEFDEYIQRNTADYLNEFI